MGDFTPDKVFKKNAKIKTPKSEKNAKFVKRLNITPE